jgi:hypothetical protein
MTLENKILLPNIIFENKYSDIDNIYFLPKKKKSISPFDKSISHTELTNILGNMVLNLLQRNKGQITHQYIDGCNTIKELRKIKYSI